MNKPLWKRLAAGALAGCLLTALAACGSKGLTEKDAETYVKGHLDALYLGTISQDYIDLVEDMTESDAKEMHEANVTYEAQILLEDFLLVEYPTDELTTRSEALIEKIYSKAQYKVGTGSKTNDGDFVVEVTVSPIEVLNLLTDDVFYDAMDAAGFADTETEEEYAAADALYGTYLLDRLEGLLSQISYGEDQIIMLQLKLDDDGYYTLMDSGMQKVDEVIIDYSGTYAK